MLKGCVHSGREAELVELSAPNNCCMHQELAVAAFLGVAKSCCAGLQVVLAGLELANALVANNASVMETMCLVGIVPTVARFAAPTWARGIRLQAARFVQHLCRTSLATAQMFVACQVGFCGNHCHCLHATLRSAVMCMPWHV